MTLATISEGHPDFADVMFLVAFILFLLAAVLSIPPTNPRPAWLNAMVFLALGLASLALAWLVL